MSKSTVTKPEVTELTEKQKKWQGKAHRVELPCEAADKPAVFYFAYQESIIESLKGKAGFKKKKKDEMDPADMFQARLKRSILDWESFENHHAARLLTHAGFRDTFSVLDDSGDRQYHAEIPYTAEKVQEFIDCLKDDTVGWLSEILTEHLPKLEEKQNLELLKN